MHYKVSVIVPVYNVENYIERCAKSLLGQTLESIEFIFIDDCSVDNSVPVLKQTLQEYPHRTDHLKIIESAINQGQSTARNIGIANANGKYLAFCDTDDWLDREAIESMYQTAVTCDSDILWTNFYVHENGVEDICEQNFDENSEECVRALLRNQMHGALWNKLYKKSLFVENEISFPDSYNMWEDLCTNIKLFFQAKKVVHLKTSFYHYVQHNKNQWSNTYQEKILSEMIHNVNEVVLFFREKNITRFDDDVVYLKLAAKQPLLISTRVEDLKAWRLVYPEVNSYILSFKKLSLSLRIIGWCAYLKLWFFVRVLLGIKKLVK